MSPDCSLIIHSHLNQGVTAPILSSVCAKFLCMFSPYPNVCIDCSPMYGVLPPRAQCSQDTASGSTTTTLTGIAQFIMYFIPKAKPV